MHPDIREDLFKYFPEKLMKAFHAMDEGDLHDLEEIRFRASRPVMLYKPDGGHYLCQTGACTRDIRQKCLYTGAEEVKALFYALARFSIYAYENEIRNGFITIENGYRVGIAGAVIGEGGGVKGFSHIHALNIRIPRQIRGISRALLPLVSEGGRLLNTLVLSAPQLGKTTLVRDIARAAGNGEGGLTRHKVCLVDERAELAALREGVPQFQVGLETDVLGGVRKSEGMTMALRALSPDVIVTDEIGREADLNALRETRNCGVTVVATAHGASVREIKKRLFFSKLLAEKAFDRLAVLGSTFGKITVESVQDENERLLTKEPLHLKG